MRLILQRVAKASVIVDGATVASIDRGLLCLLGFSSADTGAAAQEHLAWLASKVLAARLWPSLDGKPWAASCKSLGLPILLVSQFTLHGSLKKPKPDFHRSLTTEAARALWGDAIRVFEAAHGKGRVQVGVFGAMMEVALVNDGPVTLTLDSFNRGDALYEDALLQGKGEDGQGDGGGSSSGGAGAGGGSGEG